MEDLIKQLQDALFSAVERAERAETERDDALKAVWEAHEAVWRDGEDWGNWVGKYAAVIEAARKM